MRRHTAHDADPGADHRHGAVRSPYACRDLAGRLRGRTGGPGRRPRRRPLRHHVVLARPHRVHAGTSRRSRTATAWPTCCGRPWRRPARRTSGSPRARSPRRPTASSPRGSRFETAVGRGSGLLRLNDEGAWTFLTTLDELKGHEENQGTNRPRGVEHGAQKDRVTWKERRTAELEGFGRDREPYVVVIGGGQGGIALGARLRQLGVDHVVVDRHARPGDQWRSRYKSLCLHDPVWYDHLPYLPFPRNWPVFAPKDKIGDWLEMYTRVMEVNYWGSTTAKSATWDDAKKEWTVTVDRDGEEVVLHPKQLVFALGRVRQAEHPVAPRPGRLRRRAAPQLASTPARTPTRTRSVVVIGSNNSAFDICGALWEVGADVTMVQRSSTHIVKSDSLMDIGLGDLYSERAVEAGVTTHKADTIFASLPYRIMHKFQIPALRGDGRARQGVLRPAGGVGVPPRLGRRRVGPVHEVPAPRLGLLHRRRRRRPRRRTARSRSSTARSPS